MSASKVTVTDEIIRAAQDGDADAMWDIVNAYESVLVGIVRAVAPGVRETVAEDLLQDARVALIQHVHTYDTTASSAQLHTFAYRGVRRAVAEEWIRSSSGLSVEPTAFARVRQALWTTQGDAEDAWLIVGSDSAHPMSREKFLAVLDALGETCSLDAQAGDDEGLILAETLPDTSADVTGTLERRDLARWLMTQISPRQSFALRAFHGVGMERLPDADIAVHLGVKSGSVSPFRKEGAMRARMVADAHGMAA